MLKNLKYFHFRPFVNDSNNLNLFKFVNLVLWLFLTNSDIFPQKQGVSQKNWALLPLSPYGTPTTSSVSKKVDKWTPKRGGTDRIGWIRRSLIVNQDANID